jgi:hypothetical protein
MGRPVFSIPYNPAADFAVPQEAQSDCQLPVRSQKSR